MRKFNEAEKWITWVLIILTIASIAIILWVARYNAVK